MEQEFGLKVKLVGRKLCPSENRFVKKIVLVAMVLLCCRNNSFGWGFYGHKLVNYHAVFLLPPEMLAIYKPNIQYLVDHAVDPDKRRYAVEEEGPRHFLDVDRYGREVFSSFDMTWQQACNKFSEDTLKKHGIVPWWIQTMLGRLTAAFQDHDLQKILKLSAEIGHYIGDAHVPLHASSNHNGQHTGQHGIHGFWESRVPEMLAEKEWDFWIGRADYIRRPLHFIWQRVLESSRASDTVLQFERELSNRFPASGKYAFEDRNGLLVKQYSESYTREYNKMLKGMVERRFRQSVYGVACFWYTAWVNAGQPDCRKIAGKPGNAENQQEQDDLERRWREGKIRGKTCE